MLPTLPCNTFPRSPPTPCNLSIAFDNISFHQLSLHFKVHNLWNSISLRWKSEVERQYDASYMVEEKIEKTLD
jgi:hypothetical protein